MTEQTQEIVPIPEPAGLPLLGHVGALEPDFPLRSMLALTQKHGTMPLPPPSGAKRASPAQAKPRDQARSTGYDSRTGPPSSCLPTRS